LERVRLEEKGRDDGAGLREKWKGRGLGRVCVGLRKEDDGGTGCEIGGLCRRLKRKQNRKSNKETGGGGGCPGREED